MSVRDTLVRFGFVLMSVGTCIATWALITGPLRKYSERFLERQSVKRLKRETADDPKS